LKSRAKWYLCPEEDIGIHLNSLRTTSFPKQICRAVSCTRWGKFKILDGLHRSHCCCSCWYWYAVDETFNTKAAAHRAVTEAAQPGL